jgi:hypothetical protein
MGAVKVSSYLLLSVNICECGIFIVILSVIILCHYDVSLDCVIIQNVIMLSIILCIKIMNVIMVSVIMQSAIILNIIMLSVIILSVVVPSNEAGALIFEKCFFRKKQNKILIVYWYRMGNT